MKKMSGQTAAQEWLQEQVERYNKDIISGSELKNKQCAVRWLLQSKGDGKGFAEWNLYALEDLLPKDICTGLLAKLQDKSVKTQKNYCNIYKQFFNYCIASGYLRTNALQFAKIESVRTSKDLLAEKINHSEIRAIANCMEKDFQLVFTTAIQTGLRQGEQRALQWKDIDLKEKILYVRQAVTRDICGERIGNVKSKSSVRDIPLTEGFTKELMQEYLRRGRPSLEEYVFVNRNKQFLQALIFRTKLADAVKKAGVKPIRWHDLRHYFASCLFDSLGAEYFIVSSLLGHSSVEFTRQQYVHWLRNDNRDNKVRAALGEK